MAGGFPLIIKIPVLREVWQNLILLGAVYDIFCTEHLVIEIQCLLNDKFIKKNLHKIAAVYGTSSFLESEMS